MDLKILSKDDIFSENPRWRSPGASNYLAMYSSLFGGVVKDSSLMVIPLDDHMVHRGDGIFEAFECINGNLYNFDAHLSRLQKSARLASLDLPFSPEIIKDITVRTVAVSGAKDAIVRIFVSRGIGGFSCEPTESSGANLYVVVLRKEDFPEHFYREGASAVTSKVPVKPPFFAKVKSCNYLPNALAHLEAHNRGADFALFVDEEGNLAEAATESVAIVDENKRFVYPGFDRILEGTTLLRGIELAGKLVKAGQLRQVTSEDISKDKVHQSSEMLILGTGINVVPVVEYDGRKVGEGKPGPIFHSLSHLLHEDQRENKEVLTPVPYD